MTLEIKPNSLARSLPPSETMTINARAKELEAGGQDIISFAVGEPDFNTPVSIGTAGIDAIMHGKTRYSPAAGEKGLIDAIAKYLHVQHGLGYDRSQIIASNGAKQSLFNLLFTIIEPGDGVIVPIPYWVSYPAMIQLARGSTCFVNTAERNHMKDFFEPDLLAIEAYASSGRAKGIILCDPSNPSGRQMSVATLEKIGEIVHKYKLWVISDEIYNRLVYGQGKCRSFLEVCPELKNQTAIVNGVSKSWAMTGWRIGYAAGPKEWIKACASFQGQTTSGPSTPSQYAAIEALIGPDSYNQVEQMRMKFSRRASAIYAYLAAIQGVKVVKSDGAFYSFPLVDLSKSFPSDTAMIMALLNEFGVATVPGSAFGLPWHIRFSFALADDKLDAGINRFAEFVAKYR